MTDLNKELSDELETLEILRLEGEIENEWEYNFIESVYKQYQAGYSLTDVQVEKIEETYDKRKHLC